MVSVAEMERELTIERTRAGLEGVHHQLGRKVVLLNKMARQPSENNDVLTWFFMWQKEPLYNKFTII